MISPTDLLIRVADFHLSALALLIISTVVGAVLRQPARRLVVAWATAVGLLLVLVLATVPGWSQLHVTSGGQAAIARPSSPILPTPYGVDPSRRPSAPLTTFSAAPSTTSGETTTALANASQAVEQRAQIEKSFVIGTAMVVTLVGGSCLVSVWLIIGWVAGRRLVVTATDASAHQRTLLAGLLHRETAPRLLVSPQLSTAVAVGLWKPTILLPEHVAQQSSQADVLTILAHELAHLRRGDLWMLAVLRLLLVTLWANPLFWLLRRRVRLDQESLADAAAAEVTSRTIYAERLVGWARERDASPKLRLAGSAGLWEGSSQLRKRIAMLLDDRFTMIRHTSLKWRAACGFVCMALAITASLVTLSPAEGPPSAPGATASADPVGGQQMLPLRVRVVNEEGAPVAKAKVTPWALRSSQGHGLWEDDDERAGVGPTVVITDDNGTATVLYPRYRDALEQVQTISVSLFVDHPEFAFADSLHIDVPLEEQAPYKIELTRGVSVEICPKINDVPADPDGLFAMWSDGRSWQPGVIPEKTAGGLLRIPAMPPGDNSVFFAKLVGDHATHFSDIIDIELAVGKLMQIDVPLRPALRVDGVLSDNVPRPVRRGRIKAWTLPPAGAHVNRVEWLTWAPVRPDGTFTIPWPAGERLQLIALCDGYVAVSGKAPDVVENPRDPEEDPFNRPQVFDPDGGDRIEVAMTPLVPCIAKAVDEDGEPIAGVQVESWPNVGWWNSGSQIYCHPLVRGERRLRKRDYRSSIDEVFPYPFRSVTDADGRVTLELPAGSGRLAVTSEVYELPVTLGRRDVRIKLTSGEATKATLRLQPRGTERLGEWDKLAGVVFGCSTREGRRICALPGVQKQMNEIVQRFREAKDPRDPRLLSETYSAVAGAFFEVGDSEEAVKWLQKAAEQAAKIEGDGTGDNE